MDIAKTLLEFSALHGVAGLESAAVRYGQEQLNTYGKTHVTPLGNLVCTVKEPTENGVHILLDAHIDEIGMIVTRVTDEGFIRVGPCGGIDRRLLLASPVVIHAPDGDLPAVVCSVPPHLSEGEKKNVKVEEIYIDAGLEPDEAKEKIRAGSRVTLRSRPRKLLGDLVCGKAIDDRAGCVAILRALELLAEKPLNCGLSAVFSTMEEVGGMGATTAAYAVNPTHAIVMDVSFAHTPDAAREKCGEMGKGPMIGYSPILSAELSRELVRLATADDIPFQHEVMGGVTGTNADHIAVSRQGVRTALLSIPQKYMHTPIESVSVIDIENTARLIAALARHLGGEN